MLKFNIDQIFCVHMYETVKSRINEGLTQDSLCCNNINEVLDCSLLLRVVVHHSDEELASKIQLVIDHDWFDKRTCIQGKVKRFDDEDEDVCFRVTFVLSNSICNFPSTDCLVL